MTSQTEKQTPHDCFLPPAVVKYSALIRGKIMKFIGIVIGWCTMLILIVAWFVYVIYDYGITD
ncbi:hypothetical protein AL485_16100 [Serratia liquefaciens]|nr:hypothetical protein AL485_16100 [Serratia liquefaciens]